jgi:hypothetical protein
MNSITLVPGAAKQKIGQPGAVRTDNELGALEERDLIRHARPLQIDCLETIFREKTLHLLDVLNFSGRPTPRHPQSAAAARWFPDSAEEAY